MNYYSHQDRELSQAGIEAGGLAIYAGTVNPRQPDGLNCCVSSNAYVFLWQDDRALELDAQFHNDGAGLDVLEVQVGEEKYTFLRDKPSGYMRQVTGPAKPVIVANLGAIPLRVDTFLGRFTVCAGTMLRLDGNAPQREKKKVLLTVSSQYERPLKSAELWDGDAWRRLNICEGAFDAYAGRSFIARDGSAIVQYMVVNDKREILMMDAPELDPDYEIYITGQIGDWVTLCFDRTDYRDGQVVRRARTVSFADWGEQVVYDLQRLRESQTQNIAKQCTAGLPGLPPGGETYPVPGKRARPLIGDRLKEFLEIGDKPSEPPFESGRFGIENQQGEHGREDATSRLTGLVRTCQESHEIPVPEPPEDFPE